MVPRFLCNLLIEDFGKLNKSRKNNLLNHTEIKLKMCFERFKVYKTLINMRKCGKILLIRM